MFIKVITIVSLIVSILLFILIFFGFACTYRDKYKEDPDTLSIRKILFGTLLILAVFMCTFIGALTII